MDGQGLLYIIDNLGHSLAAVTAERDELRARVEQLTDALTARADHA